MINFNDKLQSQFSALKFKRKTRFDLRLEMYFLYYFSLSFLSIRLCLFQLALFTSAFLHPPLKITILLRESRYSAIEIGIRSPENLALFRFIRFCLIR